MTQDSGELTVLEGEDGFLVLGSESSLAAMEAAQGVRSRPLSPRVLGQVGVALKGVETAAAQSGRWFKADAASEAYLKAHKVRGVTSGVVRAKNVAGVGGNQGRILKHLTFEKAGLASPAAPAVLGAIAMQQALQASLADITAYLEVIDEKLDALLRQRKIEMLGQLGGIAWTLDEGAAMLDETGRISGITWSKMQGNSLALATVQAECIAQLNALAQRIRAKADDVDETARIVESLQDDFTFWVGLLARTIRLQDRQYALELAHGADVELAELDAHRRGIRVARQARHDKILSALRSLAASLSEVSDLTNLQRVANPFSSQKIQSGANAVTMQITQFVQQADLGDMNFDPLASTSWAGAVKSLFGETADQVTTSGVKVAGRARFVSGSLQRRGEAVLLAKADKIRQQRDATGEDH